MKDLILNFLLRVVFGVIAIYGFNSLFTAILGIGLHIGLNVLNLLTIGTLGFSGVGLLFGISAFGSL